MVTTAKHLWKAGSNLRQGRAAVLATSMTLIAPLMWSQASVSAGTVPSSSTQATGTGQSAGTSAGGEALIPMQNIPIGPGDLVDVEVFGTPELSGRFRVDQLGQITLPLGGSVQVKGMLTSQAMEAIQAQLKSSQIMLNPSVSVAVLEYATQGVTVLGEVRSPGIYTLLGPRSLYDAIASAGGVSSSAGSTITITHANDATHPVNVEITNTGYSAAIKAAIVQPGDTVVVNRAALIYVVGDVVHSGAFYIQGGESLTVLDVVSLADGVNRTAAMSAAKLIRQTPGGAAKTIAFNLTKVMRNEEPNPTLQAGDVLVIPRSGAKTFASIALPGLSNAVTSAVSTALIVR